MARVRMISAGVAEIEVASTRYARSLAQDIMGDMRVYVPVLTGALRSTVRSEDTARGARIWFGDVATGIDYHLYVEYGTSRMLAQPYARPAIYQWRGGKR